MLISIDSDEVKVVKEICKEKVHTACETLHRVKEVINVN